MILLIILFYPKVDEINSLKFFGIFFANIFDQLTKKHQFKTQVEFEWK